jgi:hypothetical protein
MCRASSQSLLDHDLRSNIHKTRGEPELRSALADNFAARWLGVWG